jgi:hypothetical protein
MAKVHSNTTAGAGNNTVVEIAALSEVARRVSNIIWSFDADPGNAVALRVESPVNTTIFEVDVTKGGPGPIPVGGFEGARGEAIVVTLVSDGAATGKLNVITED